MIKCTIILFRHAQSKDNAKRTFSGWRNSELTTLGKKEAIHTKKQLQKYRISYAFDSSLKRTQQTLKIALANKKIPVFTDDRIIERCYGTLQGQSKTEFENKNPELYKKYHRGYDSPPPRGESIKMVEKRTLSFLHELLTFLKKHPGNVAISAHGNSMRPIERYFSKLTIKQMMALENPQDRAIIYQIRIQKQKNNTPLKWQGIIKPKNVLYADDKKNPLKKYY
ncbi:histidine phosphatase family protein [Candidatus Woesearchaeota archaeon]|nr:histidine phosphatase family protein [Candidatus Woesearchaeota archaeon]